MRSTRSRWVTSSRKSTTPCDSPASSWRPVPASSAATSPPSAPTSVSCRSSVPPLASRFDQRRAQLLVRLAREQIAQRLSHRRRRIHAEQVGCRAVQRGHATARIGGDDARGDVGQHDLEIAPARIELRAAGLQIGRHVVERRNQRADLVVSLSRDVLVEVSLRDGPRSLGELLDRHRDAARDVEPHPGGGEEDDDGHQHEGDRVGGPDRLALHLEPEVLAEGAVDLLAAFHDAPRHEIVDHDHAGDVAVVTDRNGRPDDVGLADRVDPGGLLARRTRGAPRRTRARCPTLPDRSGRRARPRAWPSANTSIRSSWYSPRRCARNSFNAARRSGCEQLVLLELGRGLPCEPERGVGEVLVVGVRHVERSLERTLHLAVEPVLDRVAQEYLRDQEEQRRRQERDADEGDDQPGPQVRAHDAAAAVEDELHDVAADQEDEEDEEDQVQVDQADEDRVGAERSAARELREPCLDERERDDRQRRREDDVSLTPSSASVGQVRRGGRRRHHGRLVGPVRHQRRDDMGDRGRRQGAFDSLSS